MTRDTLFDLASLTKPLATTLAVMHMVNHGVLALDWTISSILPEFDSSGKEKITIRHLLAHVSGLPDYVPYYKDLGDGPFGERKTRLRSLLVKASLRHPPGKITLYSDVGFMVLDWGVERAGRIGWMNMWDRNLRPLGDLDDLFFVDLLSDRRPRRSYAATELCPVRNRLLVGEVHDDNAWFAGGVDGHAGLFGTAEAVFPPLRAGRGYRGLSSAPVFSKKILGDVFHGTAPNPRAAGL